MTHAQSSELFARAQAVTPGGVNSPVRAFRAVGGTPRFMAEASGAYLTDVDGNTYVDLVCSWGPMILGHAHPEVVEAVRTAATRSFTYGTPTPAEVDLAEEIVARVRGVEQVRLVNSGTEATMSAIRLARGVTGRAAIVKFAGNYHGHVDALLAAAGSGVATLGLPDSAGVSPNQVSDTIVLPYNDIPAVRKALDEHGASVAAVIVEAVPANMGVVAPVLEWGGELTRLVRDAGALLIVDEVMTGFRVARGGWLDHDPALGPDLVTMGKVMGGGLPAAAFGGRAEIMAHLAPVGSVYQAGTLSGNPVAAAAGLTTLRLLDDVAYATVDGTARAVRAMVSDALSAEGVEHVAPIAGNLFSVFFAAAAPRDYEEALAHQSWRYPAYFHAMLDAGVYLPPSSYEAWFVSTAHDDDVLAKIEVAASVAARAAAKVRPS